MHAEAMLLVNHGEAEIVKGDGLLKQGMRADDDVDRAGGQRIEGSGPLGSLVAAGQQREPQAARRREAAERRKMLARQNLGRRHQRRLPPGLDAGRHGEQRDQRLARADIALQQPQHAGPARKVSADLLQCLHLRARQRERQRRDNFFRNAAVARAGAAGRAPQLRPHEAQRELAGEHFVECEAHSRGRLRRDLLGRLRAMRAAQRLCE